MFAEVLDVVQGQGLGLDEQLGERLGFGWCLRRHLGFGLRLGCCLLVRLRERLDESLRFGLGLWRVSERFGICWWGLDVCQRFWLVWRRLLCERFRVGLRRLGGGFLLLLA